MTKPNLDAAWREHDAARQSGAGCVYTPRALALRLAEAVLAPLPESPAPRVLDPACGSGALLLGALEWAARHRPAWLETWAEGSLRGWDVSPAAVEACNRALSAPVAMVTDSLRHEGEADAVLANPPWISFSGRHAERLPKAERDFLRQRFAAFRGWPALHAAFAERCAELTASRGRCGLLLPLQMADLARYEPVRAAMTRRHRLESLHDLGESAFAGVTEPAGMFILAAAPGTGNGFAPATALPEGIADLQPLPASAFGDIGVHTGNAAHMLIADSAEPGAKPLRAGRDITPYALAAPRLWLRDVALEGGAYARLTPDVNAARAVILLRQTASRPIAARHEPPHLFRNSVLACFGAPGHDPDFLLAVLNSSAAAALHRQRFRDARQRAFPQLKISHLRALPVPGREIGPLYERIANAARAATAGDAAAAKLADRLVTRAYTNAAQFHVSRRIA